MFNGNLGRRALAGKAGELTPRFPGAIVSFSLGLTQIPLLPLAGKLAGSVLEKILPNALQKLVDEGAAARAGRALALNIIRDGYS